MFEIYGTICQFILSFNLFLFLASVHSQSQPEPRLDDAANPGSNLDGSTITITPSSSYDVYCYLQGTAKNWYRSSTSVSRDTDPTYDSNVYVRRITDTVASSATLALHFESFRTNDIGEYECRITTRAHVFTTLSVYLSEYIVFMIALMHMYVYKYKSFEILQIANVHERAPVEWG